MSRLAFISWSLVCFLVGWCAHAFVPDVVAEMRRLKKRRRYLRILAEEAGVAPGFGASRRINRLWAKLSQHDRWAITARAMERVRPAPEMPEDG